MTHLMNICNTVRHGTHCETPMRNVDPRCRGCVHGPTEMNPLLAIWTAIMAPSEDSLAMRKKT